MKFFIRGQFVIKSGFRGDIQGFPHDLGFAVSCIRLIILCAHGGRGFSATKNQNGINALVYCSQKCSNCWSYTI